MPHNPFACLCPSKSYVKPASSSSSAAAYSVTGTLLLVSSRSALPAEVGGRRSSLSRGTPSPAAGEGPQGPPGQAQGPRLGGGLTPSALGSGGPRLPEHRQLAPLSKARPASAGPPRPSQVLVVGDKQRAPAVPNQDSADKAPTTPCGQHSTINVDARSAPRRPSSPGHSSAEARAGPGSAQGFPAKEGTPGSAPARTHVSPLQMKFNPIPYDHCPGKTGPLLPPGWPHSYKGRPVQQLGTLGDQIKR